MKNFALIGAAGYIAPRHMQAIRDTGNQLVSALDPSDSVGIIDRYFPQASFFTSFERFDRHVDKRRRGEDKIDYFSVCSPNYLHDAHCRFGLRSDADVICEKPLVLNPWNIDALSAIENETGKKIYNILQLREHKSILALKEKIESGPKDKIYDIDLSYLTSRGAWYHVSWKGDQEKSGGIATNIGVHFFDMLTWIFGSVKKNTIHVHENEKAAGFLELERAKVRWFLSVDYNAIPDYIKAQGKTTYRSITVGGEEIEFSTGFTDLHTRCYENILKGNGHRSDAVRPAIQIVHDIRNAQAIGIKGEYHPLLND
ncbi:UNVERIFIED_CONTAM: hypothetical protein GTU68_039578 [Idotea baltica]|nr:hypothetical protein [Idotea baltica]